MTGIIYALYSYAYGHTLCHVAPLPEIYAMGLVLLPYVHFEICTDVPTIAWLCLWLWPMPWPGMAMAMPMAMHMPWLCLCPA